MGQENGRDGGQVAARRGILASLLAAVGGFVMGWFIPRRPQGESPGEGGDWGMVYHRWSMAGRSRAGNVVRDWGKQPDGYKVYADAALVQLPDPGGYQGPDFGEVLGARRSRRDYGAEALSLGELSYLLYAAQGISESGRGLRTAPSAGALYPVEVYVVVNNVAELGAGVYHYAVREHGLESLKAGDFRAAVTRAGLDQAHLGQAAVCFVLSAIFQRTRWKYRERTYRYVLLEAGHVGQSLYLAATAMGLGACAVGAFYDDDLNELLGLDGEGEAVLYIISVGRV
jgi:SagB-type dehydrogenase family enzyme